VIVEGADLQRPHPLAADAALFLDLDGTLIEFADAPDLVEPAPGLIALLSRLLVRQAGAVAIVSGRPIREVDQLVGGIVPAVAGLHGAERRDSRGTYVQRAERPAGLEAARSYISAFVKHTEGTLLEDKGSALALHYRRNPAAAQLCFSAASQAAALAPQLSIHLGHYVVELRSASISKDKAIAAFMQEHPFLGRIPVFVGDDVTDEDGFRFVRGGNGIGVLAGPVKDTLANARLDTVEEVHAWLHASVSSNGG
jgi:trehalose 6-phosphate phosphatase